MIIKLELDTDKIKGGYTFCCQNDEIYPVKLMKHINHLINFLIVEQYTKILDNRASFDGESFTLEERKKYAKNVCENLKKILIKYPDEENNKI